MLKVLTGHTSFETAYIVDDYPYGFRLRCKMAYWLETNKNGTRLVTRTTNPKKAGEVWNKPKASTYAPVKVMYLNPENGHVETASIGFYADLDKLKAFGETYGAAFTPTDSRIIASLVSMVQKAEEKRAAREAAEKMIAERAAAVTAPDLGGATS